MAKRDRERRLIERRLAKRAKKQARKEASAQHPPPVAGELADADR